MRLAEASLPRSVLAGEVPPPLRISQRMKLEASQLEGVNKRIKVLRHVCLPDLPFWSFSDGQMLFIKIIKVMVNLTLLLSIHLHRVSLSNSDEKFREARLLRNRKNY